jgi:hypothetical protein
MRTIQPCFTKVSKCHIKPTWENPFFDSLLILQLSDITPVVSTLFIMPPFVPNQWMLDTHQDKGTFDWEIFAWCVRDAMAKAGGFEKIDDYSQKDRQKYWAMMNKIEDSIEINGKTYYAPDAKIDTSLNEDQKESLL